MTSSAPSAADGERLLRRSVWPILWVAVAYCTLVTRDLDVGPVPAKFFLTVVALATWVAYRWWSRAWVGLPWVPQTILFAIGVPALGIAVAAVRAHAHDPSQPSGLHDAAVEGSRFVYIALLVPLADWTRSLRSEREVNRIWLYPVLVLALLTIGLYILHVAGFAFSASGNLGPFQGDIGVDATTGWFRAFMVTDVLFIPAVVLVFTRLYSSWRRRFDWIALAVLTVAVWLAHTRGIWLGILIGCATCLLLRLVLECPRTRPLLFAAAAVTPLVVLAVAVPTLARPLVNWATGGMAELSASVRLVQTPKLLAGVQRHLAFGSGLGSVLPSGYQRDPQDPWSFEMAYLQLLFELGVIGILLLAWLPVSAFLSGTKRLLRRPSGTDGAVTMAIAGIGCLTALLISFADNPYLITSPGTLALAISCAMCGAIMTAGSRMTDMPSTVGD